MIKHTFVQVGILLAVLPLAWSETEEPHIYDAPYGKVYLAALIGTTQKNGTVFYVCFSKDTNTPAIKYADVAVKVFDNDGNKIPLERLDRTSPTLVEVSSGLGTTASAIYNLKIAEGKKASKAELKYMGKTFSFASIPSME